MIIFLYGEDTYRSRQKLNELREKFIKEIDPGSSSLILLDGETISLEEINKAIGSGSLLAKKRLIVIVNIFKNKTKAIYPQLVDYLAEREKGGSDNIIIFWDSQLKLKIKKKQKEAVLIDLSGQEKTLTKDQQALYKFLAKQKFIQEFPLLGNAETINWLKREIEKKGGKISVAVAQALVGLVGNDLWQLSQENEKLLAYCRQNEKQNEISMEAVELLVRGNFDDNIFALTDAIANRDKARALSLLAEQLESGTNEIYLISMVSRQFRILLQIKSGLESGLSQRQLPVFLKLNPYVAQKGMSQARAFTLLAIKKLVARLTEIDYLVKSGQADASTQLSLFLAKL